MPTEPASDFGATLRQARETSGRSLRDLADTTKLGVRTLEALERNQTDKLPPGIFRRSVVRAYAREVGLDPEQTLKAFLALHPDTLPPPGVTTGPLADVATRPAEGGPWTRLAAAILAVALILAGGCWMTRRPQEGARTDGQASPVRAAAGTGVGAHGG